MTLEPSVPRPFSRKFVGLRRFGVLALVGAVSGGASSLAVEAAPPDLVGYDKEVLFVVGISKKHGSWDALPNARPDAEAFAAWMRSRKAHVLELWDEQATRRNIYRTWAEAKKVARGRKGRDRTLLVVYFAGHGVRETEAREGYLVPYGARETADYLPMKVLESWASPQTGVRHQLFILGSCYSGMVFRSGRLTSETFRKNYRPAPSWLPKSLTRRARLALTAGLDDEKVPDGGAGAGSRFGRAVLEAVERAPGAPYANADDNEDGCVSSYELGAYVHAYGGWGGVTHPYFGALPGDQQGVIAFCEETGLPAPPEVIAGHLRGQQDASPSAPTPRRPSPGTVVLEASKLRPAMIQIRGGRFMMGPPSKEEGRRDTEAQTVVEVQSFLMARTEVTQAQWTAVMGTNPSYFEGERGGGPNHPVEDVSVWEALKYLNALSAKEGLDACYDLSSCSAGARLRCERGALVREPSCPGYRLPSEAEWEYAAQAGSTAARDGLDAMAWHQGNSGERTHGVAERGADAWGLHDMLGNVWEWTDSWSSPRSSETHVVGRGCGWYSKARFCRGANRYSFLPGNRLFFLGLRAARSLP